MFRQIILLMTLTNAGLLLLTGQISVAILLVVCAFFVATNKNSYSHILNKELDYFAIKLWRYCMILFLVLALTTLVSPLDYKTFLNIYTTLSVSSVPILVLFAVQGKLAKSTSPLGQFKNIRIIRSALSIAASLILLTIFGYIGLVFYNVQPATTLIQILVVQAAVLTPLYCLRFDKPPHKLLRVTDRNLRNHTISRKSLQAYSVQGVIVAAIGLASHLLVFMRSGINSAHIDPSLPLYQQASAVTVATLVLCFCIGIVFERVDGHEYFINEHTLENKKLLKAFVLAAAVVAFTVYTPVINNLFGFQPMSIIDLITVAAFGCIYVWARMSTRHLRKHSRRAVVKLHKQIHS